MSLSQVSGSFTIQSRTFEEHLVPSLCILITDPVFANISFIIKKSVKILVSYQLLKKKEKINLKEQI